MLTFSVFTVRSAQSSLFAPSWLKEGTYAEYIFESGTVLLNNNTSLLGFDVVNYVDAAFRWECVDLNDTVAKLKVTLGFTEIERNGKPAEQNETKNLTSEVYVNTVSRAVYLQNGTLIGTTHLWLPANPTVDDEIVIWDVPPDKITLKIENLTQAFTQTPQGRQRAFMVRGPGKNGYLALICDFDTGVTTDGLTDDEPTLTTLLGVQNLSYGGIMLFADTNIDLGPSENQFDIQTLLPIVAVIAAFAIIFVTVYMRRRKKR